MDVKKKYHKKKLFINGKLPRGKIYNKLIENYSVGILASLIRKKFYLRLENTFDLNEFQRRKIQKDIDYRKFVNFKIDGKYKECIHLLLHSSINPLNIKNLIIFFTPVFILKKLLWYHQD